MGMLAKRSDNSLLLAGLLQLLMDFNHFCAKI